MKKYFSILLVASALQLTHIATLEAKPLSEKIETAKVQTQKLNINTANAEQLVALPGIGTKKAQAIVDYRKANGKFASIEDLSQVKGIGKKMLTKISSKITAK